MENKKLEGWAKLLLDTSKRNNLMNFKDTKVSTLEIVHPTISTLYTKLDNSKLEVFNKKDSYNEEIVDNNTGKKSKLNKEQFIELNSAKIKKTNQILLWNNDGDPLKIMRTITKKAIESIEETGVNIAYIALGFVHWTEKENSQIEYRAPLVLIPISINNESPIKPFVINVNDDDKVINPTFDFVLNSQYGVSLPQFTDEMSFEEYFSEVAKLIEKINKKWFVSIEAKIGLFSFLKINMYKDLVDNESIILNNQNVKSLLGDYTPDQLVKEYSEEASPLMTLHTVVDADSSQMGAIDLVRSGKSFVLQGPPGTGKSQTITNIISQCLYDNKSVLFVSEKQAALNVVFNKLKKVGLEDYCLELHSYRANKKDFINNVAETLKKPKIKTAASCKVVIEDKLQEVKELDNYEKELHRIREVINCSLHDLYNIYMANNNGQRVDIPFANIEQKGESFYKKSQDLITQFIDFIPTIGNEYRNNCWFGYVNEDLSYQSRNELKKVINDFLPKVESLIELVSNLKNNFKFEYDDLDKIIGWNKYFAFISNCSFFGSHMFSYDKSSNIAMRIMSLKEKCAFYLKHKSELENNYNENFFSIDAQDTFTKWSSYSIRFLKPFYSLFSGTYKTVSSLLESCTKSNHDRQYMRYYEDLKTLVEMQEVKNDIDKKIIELKPYFDVFELDLTSKWDVYEEQIKQFEQFAKDGFTLTQDQIELVDNYKKNLSSISAKIEQSITSLQFEIAFIKNNFSQQFYDVNKFSLSEVKNKFNCCLDNFDKLENSLQFNLLTKEIYDLDLLTFMDELINQKIDPNLWLSSFKHSFAFQWIEKIIYSTPALSHFNRVSHDKVVADFAINDVKHMDVSKAELKSNLSCRKPDDGLILSSSGLGKIKVQAQKSRKQLPIRTLLNETGKDIFKVKPCFLMSPLSVSTFIDPSILQFDVVVFDEASQIFPQDAIGAIYRGKQLIVVGDSKQMPPTNFFNSTVEQDFVDDDVSDVTDFESILDLCSVSLPQIRLKWHYRSRNEELISFSNKYFYDSDLVTFPSAKVSDEYNGVSFHYCGNGQFEHKRRVNVNEANFTVDLIIRNLQEQPHRSLGVVTFNMAQQDLIENLLIKKRAADPKIEELFHQNVEEPFFIKNLETVQGDERDTIILCITYAKDETGKLNHRFGPLNNVGGERRLNVAITRAKSNVQVVSSIKFTDIDLNRTNSVGATLLRNYLDYAENGIVALTKDGKFSKNDDINDQESNGALEKDIAKFLIEQGYKVETHIGASSFKVDLGIKSNDLNNFVIAVETDGSTYHLSQNTRDRDRLRQQILQNMGWQFCRLWSTDWFKNNHLAKTHLIESVTNAFNLAAKEAELKAKKKAEIEQEKLKQEQLNKENESNTDFVDESEHSSNISDDKAVINNDATKKSLEKSNRSEVDTNKTIQNKEQEKNINYVNEFEEVDTVVQNDFPFYEMVNKQFQEGKYEKYPIPQNFQSFLFEILKKESPLSVEWFLKRYCKMFGREKVNDTVKTLFIANMKNSDLNKIFIMDGFICLGDVDFTNLKLRVPNENEDRRDIKYISPWELAAGMMVFIRNNSEVDKNSLYTSISRKLGYQKLTQTSAQVLDLGLEYLIKQNKVKVEGDLVENN